MKNRRLFMAIALVMGLGGALGARPRTLQKRDERGSRNRVLIHEIEFDIPIPNILFSKASLKNNPPPITVISDKYPQNTSRGIASLDASEDLGIVML